MLDDRVHALWTPRGSYLDTASFGLPARPVVDALHESISQWRGGDVSWKEWNDATNRARALFAALAGTSPGRVAVGANVSGLLGLVASRLPDGAAVVAPDCDFASTLYPFLAQEPRGVKVRTVALEALADSVRESDDAVVFSAVQSSDGRVADLRGVAEAARANGALTVCDTTHAVGWLPVRSDDFDVTACSAYKWLMCPRGAAFATIAPRHLSWILPSGAGWFAKDDCYDGNYYGPDMRLAEDARRLDTSPAWLLWPATEVALRVLHELGAEAVHEHDLALAGTFRDRMGLPPGDSAVVMVDARGAETRLQDAGIVASVRAGRVRLSFHVYNDLGDVDAAVRALRA